MINKQSWEYRNKKRLYDKKYRAKNAQKIKEYRVETKEARNKYSREYRLRNKDRLRIYNREYLRKYTKDRAARDPLFKLTIRVRTLIGNAIRNQGYRKIGSTKNILGCNFDEFKLHIEKLFKEGMSWDNYGKWQIDHKVPLISAKTEVELIKLNHYTNLQPLWALDNLLKRYE